MIIVISALWEFELEGIIAPTIVCSLCDIAAGTLHEDARLIWGV